MNAMSYIEKNLQDVNHRIKIAAENVNRNYNDITLIAVTKTFDPSLIKEVIRLGIKNVGETKVQESKRKQKELGELSNKIKWHMIGHLQSNKAKDAIEIFDVIHSIDRLKIAKKISDKCIELKKIMPILVQINLTDDKFGIKPEETLKFINEVKKFDGIKVEGLMTIAPYVGPEKTRPYFKKLKELALICKLKHLSMGMSNDFEVAIEEGSTMVRVGTAIFGERKNG
jgi:hypothetical protein